MCKINFVEVSQIIEDERPVGMQYRDNWMVVTNFKSKDEAFYNFKIIINSLITTKQSIILCRDDVRKFSSSIAKSLGDGVCSRTIFSELKDFLKQNYDVKRIKLNPRTLEYRSINKSFIIHKL
jgi:hypothetical protein